MGKSTFQLRWAFKTHGGMFNSKQYYMFYFQNVTFSNRNTQKKRWLGGKMKPPSLAGTTQKKCILYHQDDVTFTHTYKGGIICRVLSEEGEEQVGIGQAVVEGEPVHMTFRVVSFWNAHHYLIFLILEREYVYLLVLDKMVKSSNHHWAQILLGIQVYVAFTCTENI